MSLRNASKFHLSLASRQVLLAQERGPSLYLPALPILYPRSWTIAQTHTTIAPSSSPGQVPPLLPLALGAHLIPPSRLFRCAAAPPPRRFDSPAPARLSLQSRHLATFAPPYPRLYFPLLHRPPARHLHHDYSGILRHCDQHGPWCLRHDWRAQAPSTKEEEMKNESLPIVLQQMLFGGPSHSAGVGELFFLIASSPLRAGRCWPEARGMAACESRAASLAPVYPFSSL
ncbi:hypothetical protein BKA81DRAFT_25428 [Phyllosticta paracitricarpa]|uniref:Uncharacterized protein n=1 Tax=Phyllosticta citricarpa TaxID=55181 RepID=A0ABR1MIA0_9PEZI